MLKYRVKFILPFMIALFWVCSLQAQNIVNDVKLKAIVANWKTDGITEDIVPLLQGDPNHVQNDIKILFPNQKYITCKKFKPPVTFRAILMTDGKDIRMAHAADEIIFNWEMNQNEFRIGGGPADGRHKPNVGRLPNNEWVGIEWVIKSDEMVIYVDGTERYRTQADFSNINEPFTIWSHNGTSTLQELTVTLPNTFSSYKIFADNNWTKINYMVRKGRIYEITAKGKWAGSSGGEVGPSGLCPDSINGSMGPPAPIQEKLLESAFYKKHPRSALIGRFGTNEWTFYVGNKLRFVAPVTDTLSFHINDVDLQSSARHGVMNLSITEANSQTISAENGLTVIGWIDSFDFLYIMPQGVYWEYGGSWERVGQQSGNYPTIINGTCWWPEWVNGKTTKMLPVANIGNVAQLGRINAMRGYVKQEQRASGEIVFRFVDNGIGATPVEAKINFVQSLQP